MKHSDPSTLPHVLIVDKDPLDRKNLTNLLEEEGYHCLQAESDLTALRELKRENSDRNSVPPVIIADINCVQILAYLNKSYRLRIPKVLALTEILSPSMRKKIKQAGAHAIFTKPCNFDDLLAMIREITEDQEHDV